MAFWGVEVKPGKPYSHSYDESKGRLRISQAALGSEAGGDKSAKSSPKTVLQCNVGDKTPIILCSLFTNTSENCHLDFQFEEEEEVVFSVLGPRSIHLSGYYIAPTGCCDGSEEYGEDIADTESEDSEFGEFSDDDEDLSDFIDDGDMDMYSSSPPRKSGVVIEEITEEEKPTNGEKPEGKKKDRKLAIVKKNDDSASPVQMDSEDEDGFPVTKKTEEDGKKRKNDDSAPESNGAEKKKKKLDKKNKKGKKENESEDQKEMKDSEKLKEESNDVPAEVEMKELENAAPGEASEKEGKKKKKKKNKKTENENNSSNKKEKEEKEKDEEKQPQKTRTFSNGLVIEDLKMGRPDGKRANPGSKVSVNYIGKLKSGKIFDSNVGQRPFKFRLGIGQVIKGWDVGVNGMRVGDKRRLTIPPAMGYGDKKVGGIPKSSWLVFDVELVDVN